MEVVALPVDDAVDDAVDELEEAVYILLRRYYTLLVFVNFRSRITVH